MKIDNLILKESAKPADQEAVRNSLLEMRRSIRDSMGNLYDEEGNLMETPDGTQIGGVLGNDTDASTDLTVEKTIDFKK